MQKSVRVRTRSSRRRLRLFRAQTVSARPYAVPAAVQIIFDLAGARDPRAKTADPQGFIDMRFVREIEQSGAIDQLYGR